MQRTLIQDHTTNETFFIEGNVTLEWIFENQASGALPSFRIFCHFVPFLVKALISDAHGKFLTRRTHTLWVCKTFPWVREIQRTLNQDHATNETFFIEGKVTLEQIFENQASEALPSIRIFCHFVPFLAKTLTSEGRRKFFIRRTHTFWVCKTFLQVREMQRTLNHDRTIDETFFI